eukprot:CFRG2707T1
MSKIAEKERWNWVERSMAELICDAPVVDESALWKTYRMDCRCTLVNKRHSNKRYNISCTHGLGEKRWLSQMTRGLTPNVESSAEGRHRVTMTTNKDVAAENAKSTRSQKSCCRRVGLRNLGNTCYMNAILQMWFHNVALRNILYNLPIIPHEPVSDSKERTSSPLFELQKLFGMMQLSNRRIADPSSLLKSLRLPKNEQQDAQEFFKLFMSQLEEKVEEHTSSSMSLNSSNAIKDLFGGEMMNVVECRCCGKKSETKVPFYELELPIAEIDPLEGIDWGSDEDMYRRFTLEFSMQSILKAEELEGENRYRCETCKSLQNASRHTELRSLPPVLHLQLMRFVFDMGTLSKRKLFTPLLFPEVLYPKDFGPTIKLNNPADENIPYDVTAVLVHQGATAYSGHYVAHVLDISDRIWYRMSDESVEPLSIGSGTKPTSRLQGLGQESENFEDIVNGFDTNILGIKRKKVKKRKSLPAGRHSTTNAYMLCYKRRDNKIIPHISEVPKCIETEVGLDNCMVKDEEQSAHEEKKREDVAHQQHMKTMTSVVRWIQCEIECGPDDQRETAPSDFISTKWIKNVFENGLLAAGPINNESLICEHGFLNPDDLSLYKRINRKSAEHLYLIANGGPRLTERDLCRSCVIRIAKKKALIVRLRNDQDVVRCMMKSEACSISSKNFLVSHTQLKEWLKKTAKLNLESVKDVHLNQDIQCEHGNLMSDETAWRIISAEAWHILVRHHQCYTEYTADSQPCFICTREATKAKEEAELSAAYEKEVAGHLLSHTYTFYDLVFPHSLTDVATCDAGIMTAGERAEYSNFLYMVPHSFLKQWKTFVKNPQKNSRPKSVESSSMLCKHGGLAFSFKAATGGAVTIDSPTHRIALMDEIAWNGLSAVYEDAVVLKLQYKRVSNERGRSTLSGLRGRETDI